MIRTRAVLAGPFTSSPFADGLRMLLDRSGRFDVVEATDHSEIGHLLSEDRPVVVVAEGIDLGWALTMIDGASNVSVVLLDDAGRRAVLVGRDPGARRLVRLVEDLASLDEPGPSRPSPARLHLVGPSEAIDGSEPHPVRCSTTADLDPVVRWIELVLGCVLARRSERAGGPSVAGWTTSPGEALAGLGLDDATREDLAGQLDEVDRSLVANRVGLPPVLARVGEAFRLPDDALRTLLLALAPELDGRFGVAFGVLHDDLSRRRPSLTLVDELSGEPEGAWRRRQELEAVGSLLDLRLVAPDRHDTNLPVVEAGLVPLPALVAALMAEELPMAIRAVGGKLLRPWEPVGPVTESEKIEADRFRSVVAERATTLVLLADTDGGWFERLASAAGVPLIDGDVRALATDRLVDHAVADWLFLAALTGGGLVLRGVAEMGLADHRRLADVVRAFDGTVRVVASDAPIVGLDDDHAAFIAHRPRLDLDARIELWAGAADVCGLMLTDADASAIASTLPLDAREIASVVAGFAAQPRDPDRPVAPQLRRFAVEQRRDLLPPTVRPITARFDWDDLVLAGPVKSELRAIAAHQLLAGQVLDRWGFAERLSYGRGVSALFAGASGTGKTMAAQILAAELGVELLLVDLSRTVSKYLGETEKNVDEAFSAAERRGALLLFDEADALFGKRSEVKDAHDRHANVEIAYLLQRMEAFDGIAILTSNLKQNIDNAFLRRLRFVVDFPMPDAAERETIWRRAFPDGAQRADDIDFGFLGRWLELTGGTIQQIAIHAAFAAAATADPIGMEHVVAATRRQLDKLGMFDASRALEARAARFGAA